MSQVDVDKMTARFDGYTAELIRLQAEKKGMSVEAFVISLFDTGCNAPASNGRRKDQKKTR